MASLLTLMGRSSPPQTGDDVIDGTIVLTMGNPSDTGRDPGRGSPSGLSLGLPGIRAFNPVDGFGGGGGLGPPGGLEKAVWDNMHKKKKGQ